MVALGREDQQQHIQSIDYSLSAQKMKINHSDNLDGNS